MFNPKELLDAIIAGSAKQGQAAPQAGGQADGAGSMGDLADILRKMGGQPAPQGGQPSGGGGLGDLLEQLRRAAQGGQAGGQAQRPQAQPQSMPQPQGGGGLGDILGEIFGRMGQGGPAAQPRPQPGQPQGAPAQGRDLLEEIFGPKTGAGAGPGRPQQPSARVEEAMDSRQQLEDIVRRMQSGQGTPELIDKLKDMVARNQLGAGAVIGALGSLLVGGKASRGLPPQAAKLGGLVLVGGLAHQAYQNYAQSRPAGSGLPLRGPAPAGSGFEPEAQSDEVALLYIRTMIAAAAADGEVDQAEYQQLIGGMQQAGLGNEAAAFLKQEFANPAGIEEIVQATSTGEAAMQVYTAARVAIEPDTREEQAFLQALARGLGVDQQLAGHIDALATGMKAYG
jgi:uncharacterized membrane protein YebE (DUF533 family)